MSVLGTVHTIVPFDAKKSKPFDSQRLCKVVYKTTKSGEKKQSVCVSIPAITEISEEFIDAAVPYIRAMMESAQDAIVRSLHEEGKTEVMDSDIEESEILKYLEAEAKGERLSKESVSAWFVDTMQDALTVALADRLGLSDTPTEQQTKELDAAITVYREKFASLSGAKTSYDERLPLSYLKRLQSVM
jgi:hypothetical protein